MQNFWNQKNVLVTGATGLVGGWLVGKLLALNAQVTVLLRDPNPHSLLFRTGNSNSCTLINGKLEEYEDIERAINKMEIDTVFHLGAQTIVGTALRNPLSTFEANIRGTYQLLEACRRHPTLVKRIVVASSDKAYGSSDQLPYTEEMPLAGLHPYDVSKSCTDLLASAYAHTYGLPVAIARCGNIYGGGDLNWSRLIPGTVRGLLDGLPPVIRSDGTYTRDYIYVEDVVSAYLLLAERLQSADLIGEAFNFGLDFPSSVITVVDTLQKLMGCTHLKPHILNQAHSEIRDQTLCSKKAKRVLNWQPHFSLEEGLIKTIEWYKCHLTPSMASL